jgi:thiol-disulfide isomerase/thioredoxin
MTTPAAACLAALFYAGLALSANPARAEIDAGEIAEARAALAGDMRKLVLHDVPRPAPDAAFEAEGGGTLTLADFRGRVVLLNFWATWCAPCREEMPALDALQRGRGGDAFAVVTVATGRNNPDQMKRFFEETGVTALPLHADPRSALARAAGILGLPVTLVLDREGREVGRLTGGADWNGPEARKVLDLLLAADAS